MLIVLGAVADIDISVYAASLARYREMEQQLSQDGEEMSSRLNRLVIEDEYTAYIKDKAAQHGLNSDRIKLEMHWNTGGFWMPAGVQMELSGNIENLPELQRTLESQLGIPREKQKCSLVP